MVRIAIVDYGMGNLHSVKKAFEKVDASVEISSDPNTVRKSQSIVLPGQGAFGDAVNQLINQDLWQPLKDHIIQGKLYFGICLGLQLLMEGPKQPCMNANVFFNLYIVK